jgi:hypothetical protein
LHVTHGSVDRCAPYLDDVHRQHYGLLYGATMEHLITVHASMGNHAHLFLSSSGRDALTGVMRRSAAPNRSVVRTGLDCLLFVFRCRNNLQNPKIASENFIPSN